MCTNACSIVPGATTWTSTAHSARAARALLTQQNLHLDGGFRQKLQVGYGSTSDI